MDLIKMIEGDLERLAVEELIPLSPTCTDEFLNNPDGVSQHHPKWHQFGILTHSLKCLESLDTKVFPEIERLGKHYFIKNYFAFDFSGMSKMTLLRIALMWHDLGKWAGRKIDVDGTWDFKGHEVLSEKLILNLGLGKRHGLTDRQQDYVAKLTGLHYIIGPFLRKVMKKVSGTFAPEEDLANICRQIKSDYPENYPEIFIMFLADTIAKGNTGHPEQKIQTTWGWETFRLGIKLVE